MVLNAVTPLTPHASYHKNLPPRQLLFLAFYHVHDFWISKFKKLDEKKLSEKLHENEEIEREPCAPLGPFSRISLDSEIKPNPRFSRPKSSCAPLRGVHVPRHMCMQVQFLQAKAHTLIAWWQERNKRLNCGLWIFLMILYPISTNRLKDFFVVASYTKVSYEICYDITLASRISSLWLFRNNCVQQESCIFHFLVAKRTQERERIWKSVQKHSYLRKVQSGSHPKKKSQGEYRWQILFRSVQVE